jgi:hypothetical protein
MRFARFPLLLALGALLALPIGASAQTDAYHNARRLGGSTSFYKPPLTNAASLKKMMASKRVNADLRTVLEQAGLTELTDKVIATLSNPTEIVRGGNCAEAAPPDGTIVECDFAPGGTIEWMAYRPIVKRKPTPSLLRSVRWSGKRPFKTFLFRVSTDDKIYTFLVPKPCANVSLMKSEDIPKPPVQLTVDRRCVDYALQGRITASGDLSKVARVRVSLNGSPAGELTGPAWSMNIERPGTYTFEATDRNGKAYPVANNSLMVEACPPKPAPPPPAPPPTCNLTLTAARVKGGFDIAVNIGGSDPEATYAVEVYDPANKMVGQRLSGASNHVTVPRKPPGNYTIKGFVNGKTGSGTCEATINPETAAPPVAAAGPSVFFDGAFGKERRVRDVSDVDNPPVPVGSTATEFGQCTPLLGLKVGVAKRFANDWELAGSAGVAIPLTTDDDKVKETALIADVEANKYLTNGVFVGTGLSFWDITRSDTFTPAWLVHFGIPLNKGARVPVYFIGEGRLFFDHIDDVENNYQFWGGLRVHFPTH